MKKLVVAGLAVGLVMAGVLVALLGPWPCRVTRANCERIKPGMTRAEVERVLGGPPEDYRTLPHPEFELARFTEIAPPVWPEELWIGDTGDVYVGFMPGGIVAEVRFEKADLSTHSPVAVATWRLKRLKERWLP